VAAFAAAFLATAALWWLYFASLADLGEHALAEDSDRTLLARDAYTYGHAVLVAGIILSAVGDELVIAHPTDELPPAQVIAVVAGPALYLLAQSGLRLRMGGRLSASRLAGALACVAIGVLGSGLPALGLAVLLLAVLIAVALADRVAAARRQSPRPLPAR
jgi:low temperature requirement protein LtrA